MGGGEVIKKGWLVKSPPLEGGGIKAWRKRYFMLRSSKILEYYKSADGALLKGVINLEDCKTVHSDLSHKKYKFVFDVETKDRIYYLVAQSAEEMKSWVDQLCHICGLTVQDEMEFIPSADAAVLSPSVGASASAGPTISFPVYATTTTRRAPGPGPGAVPFNERFKPSSEPAPTMESMYSLAHSVESEVQRQLSGEQDVAAGTPLSEALAVKGIGARSSSISSASGGETLNTSMGSDSPAFLSPLHEPSLEDTQNLYSPIPKKPYKGGGGGALRPVPKPRAASLSPRGVEDPSSHHHDLAASMSESLSRGAEMLANGYMQPRRLGNYDHLPLGPPRPAVGPNACSPKQHRSALLRDPATTLGEELSPSPAGPSPGGPTPAGPTYINVHRMAEDLPPMISRKNKPSQPSPPRIDRKLKPNEDTPSSSMDDSSAESPPTFPTRTTSLNTPAENPLDHEAPPPVFQARTMSLSNIVEVTDPSRGSGEFVEGDLPRANPRTMQYTQVEFDANTGKHSIAQLPDFSAMPQPPVRRGSLDDIRHTPIPAPRPRGIGRVNYSDVDLAATNAMATSGKGLSRTQVTLQDAERLSLQDKPYVNVIKDGGKVDEDTDPGYYVHMRNLTYQEALEIYNTTSIDMESGDEGVEEQDVR